MNVRVCLPAPLQPYADGRAEVPLAAATVGEAISVLAARHPGMAPHLLSGGGQLRSFLALFLNDVDVRHAGGLSAALADGDVLTLVPSVAGGRSAGPGATEGCSTIRGAGVHPKTARSVISGSPGRGTYGGIAARMTKGRASR